MFMNRLIAYALASIAIIAVVAFAVLNHGTGGGAGQSVTTQAQAQGQATLFSSTPYSQYSYLISSTPLSAQARAALAGFNVTDTLLANGTAEVVVTLSGSGQGQTVMVKPGYKLYFIETTFGDDGYGFDSSLGDDGIVLVNQTGYVV